MWCLHAFSWKWINSVHDFGSITQILSTIRDTKHRERHGSRRRLLISRISAARRHQTLGSVYIHTHSDAVIAVANRIIAVPCKLNSSLSEIKNNPTDRSFERKRFSLYLPSTESICATSTKEKLTLATLLHLSNRNKPRTKRYCCNRFGTMYKKYLT